MGNCVEITKKLFSNYCYYSVMWVVIELNFNAAWHFKGVINGNLKWPQVLNWYSKRNLKIKSWQEKNYYNNCPSLWVLKTILITLIYFLQEIGIFMGCLIERMTVESNKMDCRVTASDLKRISKLFKDAILKCRHWVSTTLFVEDEGCVT